jgi:hypothetical protein
MQLNMQIMSTLMLSSIVLEEVGRRTKASVFRCPIILLIPMKLVISNQGGVKYKDIL